MEREELAQAPAEVLEGVLEEAPPGGFLEDRRWRDELLRGFLQGKSPETLRAYRKSLDLFREFLEGEGWDVPTLGEAIRVFFGGGRRRAHQLALRWRDRLVEEGRSKRTANVRLAALRSLVNLAQMMCLVEWTLRVPGFRVKPKKAYGLTEEEFLALAEKVEGDGPKARRDRAILALMAFMGLRRGEIQRLRMGDLDRERWVLWVQEKGRWDGERVDLTIPTPARFFLEAWLEARGEEEGPLFFRLDRGAREGERTPMGGASLYRLLQGLAEKAGIKAPVGRAKAARPHGLRHVSITVGLDKTGGNMRMVQKFARHADPRMTEAYDDSRADYYGEVAEKVAWSLLPPSWAEMMTKGA